MRKEYIAGIALVLLFGAGIAYYFGVLQKDDATVLPTATYSDGVTTVDAVFDISADTVTFTHPSVGTVTLSQAISGSGARYANEDESIVFWEHQNEATISHNGEDIFTGAASD